MSGYPGGRLSGLLTDLYELTMAAGYVQKHFEARATFELFVRHLPPHRNYLVAAGLEQALDFLGNVHFSSEDISYLHSLPLFRHVDGGFFEFLTRFRFTGAVWALPEGTIFFPGEPLLRVTAPIAEAQLVETSLLSIVHLQTLIASKAARVTTAAAGRPVVEFGSRRAHGIEAGVLAARAAFIAGCAGTSNTYAGHRFGIPVYGTQAHSWIMAHEDEVEAFRNFLDVFPEQSTLLVDTYDVQDRKSTRLNSSHVYISYAVFCLKKKKNNKNNCSSTSWDVTEHAHIRDRAPVTSPIDRVTGHLKMLDDDAFDSPPSSVAH